MMSINHLGNKDPAPPQQPCSCCQGEAWGLVIGFAPLPGSLPQFSHGYTTHKDMKMGIPLQPGHAREKLVQPFEL